MPRSLVCVRFDRVSVPERATGRWLPGAAAGRGAIRALLDKVLPREEELKAQQAMQLMQESNYTDALPLLKDARAVVESERGDRPAAGRNADCAEPF